MDHVPWLTLVLMVPLGAAILLQLVPKRATGMVAAVTLLGTLGTAAIVAGILVAFRTHVPATSGGSGIGSITFQFEERHAWIPGIGASYHLGVDGVSGWLLALNAGVFAVGALAAVVWRTERLKVFCTLLLLTEVGTAGVLLSVDLLLFYLFWEGMLIPLYFLLSSYGDQNRGRATLKFIVYTVAGSLLMLVAIIYLYFQSQAALGAGHLSFDLQSLVANPPPNQGRVSILGVSTLSPQQWAFIAFGLAFAIKVPIVPFHTWLPDSYASANPALLVFFAGIVSKLGAYGFIRYVLTLFPGPVHDWHWVVTGMAVAGIIYGALMALSQNDIKRIVAYASISHLGFVVLGIFVLNQNGLNGAVIQMVNHGVIIAALFLIVGMIEMRTGTRDRHELAGLEKRMPWLYAAFLVATLAGLGMPGMNSFVGEFAIMLGAFQAAPVLAVLAGFGVVLACWYMLRLHQGLMADPLQALTERVRDIRFGEAIVLAPLLAVMLLLGVFPRPVGDISKQSASQYVSVATRPVPAQPTAGGGQP